MVCTIGQNESEAGHPSYSAANGSGLETDITWTSDWELLLDLRLSLIRGGEPESAGICCLFGAWLTSGSLQLRIGMGLPSRTLCRGPPRRKGLTLSSAPGYISATQRIFVQETQGRVESQAERRQASK